MSHSKDLRHKALAFVNNTGATIESACKIFEISRSSFQRWRSRLKDTGSLQKTSRTKVPYKIDNDKLKEFIKNKPDAYLDEIASHFQVTPAAISIAFKRLKITRKKKAIFTANETQIKG
jgi:transposase